MSLYKRTISSKHDVHKHNELSARTSVHALKQVEDCFNVFLCARDVKIKIFVFGDIWCLQRGNVRTEYLIIIDNIMEWNLYSVIRAIQIYPGDDDDNDNEIMKSVFFAQIDKVDITIKHRVIAVLKLTCLCSGFIIKCLNSSNSIVRFVARRGVLHQRMHSPIGRNAP